MKFNRAVTKSFDEFLGPLGTIHTSHDVEEWRSIQFHPSQNEIMSHIPESKHIHIAHFFDALLPDDYRLKTGVNPKSICDNMQWENVVASQYGYDAVVAAGNKALMKRNIPKFAARSADQIYQTVGPNARTTYKIAYRLFSNYCGLGGRYNWQKEIDCRIRWVIEYGSEYRAKIWQTTTDGMLNGDIGRDDVLTELLELFDKDRDIGLDWGETPDDIAVWWHRRAAA
jgi:hypothetical protein